MISHPLIAGVACPILQYVDDTLTICNADANASRCLKHVIDDFASATGLSINFAKSTFVPMHAPQAATHLASILGCVVSSFPQTYFGLPLSLTNSPSRRLRLVDKIVKYLARWQMSSLVLPRGVIKAIDKRCQAFFWTGAEKCSGSKCSINQDKMCFDKQECGVGMKDL